jgi:transposase-like protein
MADNDRIDDGVVPAMERRKHSREFKEMVVRAAMQPHAPGVTIVVASEFS